MDKLSIKNCKNRWRPEVFYEDLAINGHELYEWFLQYTDDVAYLYSAFDLRENKDTEMTWVCVGQTEVGTCSYAPLLVCSDDMDLDCTVLMTEQIVEQEKIIWKRFGWLTAYVEHQSANDIEWLENIPSLSFERDNFIEVFTKLREAVLHSIANAASIPAQFINFPDIQFPAIKELWELEDFSYLQDVLYRD